MARPKKSVATIANLEDGNVFTGTGGNQVNCFPFNFPAESREDFIKRVATQVVCNVRDWEAISKGKTVAIAAVGMATELANQLGMLDKGE